MANTIVSCACLPSFIDFIRSIMAGGYGGFLRCQTPQSVLDDFPRVIGFVPRSIMTMMGTTDILTWFQLMIY